MGARTNKNRSSMIGTMGPTGGCFNFLTFNRQWDASTTLRSATTCIPPPSTIRSVSMRDMGHINDSYWKPRTISDRNTGESNKSKLFSANNSTKDVRPQCSIGARWLDLHFTLQIQMRSDQDPSLGGSSESPNRSWNEKIRGWQIFPWVLFSILVPQHLQNAYACNHTFMGSFVQLWTSIIVS